MKRAQVAVIIPWRESLHRRRQLDMVLALYATTWPEYQVIVAEADDEWEWCKAAAVEAGLRQTRRGIVVIADADVWAPDLPEAVAAVQAGAPWAMPFGRVHRLSEAFTMAMLEDERVGFHLDGHQVIADGWQGPLYESKADGLYQGVLGGGMVVLPAATYRQVPMDPRFKRWGGEDVAWGYALQTLAGPVHRVDHGNLLHLWHPPAYGVAADRGTTTEPVNRLLFKQYQQAQGLPGPMRHLVEHPELPVTVGRRHRGNGVARPAPRTDVIDVHYGREYYRPHLEPIARALGAKVGVFTADKPGPEGGPVLVAGGTQQRQAKGRPVIRAEHGMGISYGDGHPSYAGSRHAPALALAPHSWAAVAWRDRHADLPVHVVGSPNLDVISQLPHDPDPGLVVFSWHAAGRPAVPETGTALPHYRRHLPDVIKRLRQAGLQVAGHHHPLAGEVGHMWQQLGVEHIGAFSEVMRRAAVYVVDNSSTLYEAATRMPVVALNCPEYRRHIDFGLRFWDAVPGPQVDDPADLVAVIEQQAAITRYRPPACMAEVWPTHTRGKAAELAAAACRTLLP